MESAVHTVRGMHAGIQVNRWPHPNCPEDPPQVSGFSFPHSHRAHFLGLPGIHDGCPSPPPPLSHRACIQELPGTHIGCTPPPSQGPHPGTPRHPHWLHLPLTGPTSWNSPAPTTSRPASRSLTRTTAHASCAGCGGAGVLPSSLREVPSPCTPGGRGTRS